VPRSTPTPTPTPRPQATATVVVTPAAVPVAGVGSPAPALVQIENSQASRPQSGVGAAAIVYEYVAEGGVSRWTAIYATPPLGEPVGPVRSVRLATIELLRIYAGVLAYSGGSDYLVTRLRRSGGVSYNEDSAGGDLFRVSTRFAPHNLFSDGKHLADLLGRAQVAPTTYAFPSPTSPATLGAPATTVHVAVSQSETPTWRWVPRERAWTRSERDTGPVSDAAYGGPLLAGTVIVQQVRVATTPEVVDVNGVTGVSHTLTGTGRAQVFVRGAAYDATWTQPQSGPPVFTLSSGQPAPVAPGVVFIELVPTGSPATFS
jgi:hypothetical protein